MFNLKDDEHKLYIYQMIINCMEAGERNKILIDLLDYSLLEESNKLTEDILNVPQAKLRGMVYKQIKSTKQSGLGGVHSVKIPMSIMNLSKKYNIAHANLKNHLDRLEKLSLIFKREFYCVEEGIKGVEGTKYIGIKKAFYITSLGKDLLSVLIKMPIGKFKSEKE